MPSSCVSAAGPTAQLMQDPAWLLLGRWIDAPALQPGESLQCADREANIQRQRHPCGQQAVAPEQPHKPGSPRRDERPGASVFVADQQCPQVAFCSAQHLGQHLILGCDVGRGATPCFDGAARSRALEVVAASRYRPVCRCRLCDDLGLPALAGRQHDLPGQHSRYHGRIPGRDHRQSVCGIGQIGQHQFGAEHRRFSTVQWCAALFDRKEISEIGVGMNFQGDHSAFVTEVFERDRFAQAARNESFTHQQQIGVTKSCTRRFAQR